MRHISIVLLFLGFALLGSPQQAGNFPVPAWGFDSAVPTPLANVDVTQTQPNLRIQNQQPPPLQADSPVQAAPQPQQNPQQPPVQTPQPAASAPAASQQSPLAGQQGEPKLLLSEVNQAIVSKGFKVDQGVSYQRIKVGELKQKYLFFNFNLAEKDKWQTVNITISREGSQQILNKCQYSGVDNCYVPAFSLKENSVLFVHIQCQDDCTYNLKAQWSDTEHLRPGEEVIFMFGKDTRQIYHVELDEEEDFEEARIHLAPRVTRKPFDNIKIYGKFGKNAAPTPQDYDFKSINLWEDGEGIFLKPADLKQKKFVLLIVGQTETTYRLSLELVRESAHEIENGEHIYEYLQAKSEKSYHIKSIPNVFDEYSLRFSVLSGGELDIGYFTDKELKEQLQFKPYEYMRDSEYVLNTEILDPTKDGLYLSVKTKDRDATYTVKFVGRKKADSIELNENVYGFIQVQNASRFAHFDFKRWAEETDVKATSLKFTVYMIEAAGKVAPEFFVCTSTLSLCTNPAFYRNTTLPIATRPAGEVSQKKVYELQIEDKVLKKINVAEQQATIIVKLDPADKKSEFNLVAIELLNNNKVLYLREGRPLEEKMGEKEMKVYKYINSDPNVEEIRIHVNEIVGGVIFSGFIQGDEPSKSVQIAPEGTTLRFTTNLTQPIYVSVTAQSKSIFGISMQVIHRSSLNKNVTVATISEDLTYTVRIQPNSFAIYEVVPIFYGFNFRYSASQSVIVCAINPATNSCIDPESGELVAPHLGVKGAITKAQLVDRKARVKITNPFSDSIAEVTFIFHSRSVEHCEGDKKLGQVYQESVTDGKCVAFLIDEDKTVELYVSKREFASLNYRVLLCGNVLANASSVKTLEISPQIIGRVCGGSTEGRRLEIVWAVATQSIGKEERSVRVDLLAQYRGAVVVLSEGVSYNKIAVVQEGMIGKFAFNILNKRDTKVILNQIRGIFKVYAKVVDQSYRDSDPISNINYQWASSQTLDYSQEPIILISEADILKEHCVSCAVLIAVYSDMPRGAEVEFDIQIVQKYSVLNEDTAVEGYLDAGSFAYYSYFARQEENSTILVLLSDHNQQCANMYLSLLENPGPTSHIAKTVAENELIFRHAAGERKYYLAVEAVKTCDYSLSVLTIDSSIHNLKRGKQNLIKFPAGVVKYFSLDHYTNEPFKVLALAKYGEINIYLNQSALSVDRKSFTTEELALEKFAFKSSHPNTLALDSTSPLFCQRCNYFLAIEALKNTEATLYLVYPQTIVTLTEGHFLSDFLAKNGDYTVATYNRLEKTQMSLRVHSGALKIMAVYKGKTVSATFSAREGTQALDLDFEAIPSEEKSFLPEADPNLGTAPAQPAVVAVERIPINIMIIASSANVSYTLEMKSLVTGGSINQLASYQSLLPGEPNRVVVSSSKALCLTGYLREANESLILSANNDNRAFLGQLVMQATVSGEKADISKTYTRNIMGISLAAGKAPIHAATTGAPYELCLKLAEPAEKGKQPPEDSVTEVEGEDSEVVFNATITQANTVNILASDTDSVVLGESIFVIHSEGEFLLDVFECRAEAKISVGSSLENIEKSKLKMLDAVNMPDQRHAIKISEKETTFVRIRSQHSVVRWIPIDYEAERGLGYIKFSSGDLRYSSKFKEIAVEYQPLQQSKPTKAKVTEIRYTLYVSNETEAIDFSSQCSTDAPNVHLLPLPSPPLLKATEGDYLSRSLEQKQELEERFPGSENIYFRVVCELSLTVAAVEDEKAAGRDEHEHYRFIYGRQQVPLESFRQGQIESIPYHYLILLLAATAAILLLCTYLFTRKIVPLLARLRSSNLVEEEPAQEHRDDLEVPASSDRNQRAPDIAVETDEKFGK